MPNDVGSAQGATTGTGCATCVNNPVPIAIAQPQSTLNNYFEPSLIVTPTPAPAVQTNTNYVPIRSIQSINNNQNPNSMNNQVAPNTTWRGCVPPAPIVLTATVGAGITTVYMPDSTGLFVSYGGAVGGQAFDVGGPATPANLSSWLQSSWLYVKSFSLQSTITATLSNSLVLITSQMNGSNLPQTISSAANVSNQQYNANLLNICCGFVLTYATALRLPITTSPGEVVTLTLTIGACGSYGTDLADFMSTNPLITCSGNSTVCP